MFHRQVGELLGDGLEALADVIETGVPHARSLDFTAMPTTPQPLTHEWVGFEEPDGTTWLFDATFLLSSWTCIFGNGCKGVLTADATELGQGCCSYGAHFADKADRKTVADAAKRLTADVWQFAAETKSDGGPITRNADGDWVTRQIDDACCFLNRPGFPGGAGCALHSAALAACERPMDWKPDVCWQLPLRLISETDQNGHVTNTLREWKRRDWGEGGDDFHWWCTETHEAFVGSRLVYQELRDEIVELVGDTAYQWFVDYATNRQRRGLRPHPAVQSAVQPVPAPTRRRSTTS